MKLADSPLWLDVDGKIEQRMGIKFVRNPNVLSLGQCLSLFSLFSLRPSVYSSSGFFVRLTIRLSFLFCETKIVTVLRGLSFRFTILTD